MKNLFLLSLLFLSAICNAKFLEGTIVFKDGHSESGYIKSFLEDKFFDYTMFKKFEQKFNLDDNSIKFKKTKDDGVILYKMDDVAELQIKNGTLYEIYVPLTLKTLNKKGEIIDKKIKVWLPLIKKGKINLYGYEYHISSFRGDFPEDGYQFYYQSQDSDFALSPYDNVTMFGKKSNAKIYNSFYNYLFKSCPDYYSKHAAEIQKEINYSYSKEEQMQMTKDYIKREKDFRNKKDRTLLDAFELENYETSKFINDYNSECN
jgi:hypothetical protein